MVGKSGRSGEQAAVVTASERSFARFHQVDDARRRETGPVIAQFDLSP
jgi:hypothetical protein